MGQRAIPISPNQLRRMCLLYEGGYSLQRIASEYHLGKTTVWKALRGKVKMRSVGCAHYLPHVEYERTVALRREGMSITAIADELGIHYVTVYERLCHAGVYQRLA